MGLTIYFDERALRRWIDRSAREWPDAAGKALEKVGREAFAESQREVPVGKTRTLKQQTFFNVTPRTVTFGYTNWKARIVHFRKARHKTGKRNFVLRPQNRARRILGPVIAMFVQDAMDHTPTS